MKHAPRRPDWHALHLHALDHLPRVLAGMGFSRIAGPLPWGGTPLYDRRALHRYRAPPGRPSPWAAQDRADLAHLNRGRMAEPVRLALAPIGPAARAIYVSEVRGDWSDETGGARGETLMDLGALGWSCRYGQAGWRIARLAGLDAIPLREAPHA